MKGTVTNCYSTGMIRGDSYVGGLVGWNHGAVTQCYSNGAVNGYCGIGGLVGVDWGSVGSSFWDMEASGKTTSGGGTDKTTVEMQIAGTFLEAGWDFIDETENGTEDIWTICEWTNYPRFVWQIPVGDFVCPDVVTMLDFSLFAMHWLDDNCDPSNDYCEGTDLDLSGAVDINDFEAFADNWLGHIAP